MFFKGYQKKSQSYFITLPINALTAKRSKLFNRCKKRTNFYAKLRDIYNFPVVIVYCLYVFRYNTRKKENGVKKYVLKIWRKLQVKLKQQTTPNENNYHWRFLICFFFITQPVECIMHSVFTHNWLIQLPCFLIWRANQSIMSAQRIFNSAKLSL